MAHRTVYAADSKRYGTRMLTAGDPLTLSGPAARAMIALGRATATKPRHTARAEAADVEPGDELASLRAAYLAKTGKRPFNGWNAETLRAKLVEA